MQKLPPPHPVLELLLPADETVLKTCGRAGTFAGFSPHSWTVVYPRIVAQP